MNWSGVLLNSVTWAKYAVSGKFKQTLQIKYLNLFLQGLDHSQFLEAFS